MIVAAQTCRATINRHFLQQEALMVLNSRLVPQISPVMKLSRISVKQCKELDVTVRRSFLSLLRVNKSTPTARVYGPTVLGGIGLAYHQEIQDQWGISYLMKSLRWGQTWANNIIAALRAFQRVCGFVCYIIGSPDVKINYISTRIIPHTRD